MSLNNYDTIILDCDGVVFNSNILKIKAFEETLKELGFNKKQINDFLIFFKNNFGTSRYKLIEYFIENVLKTSFDKTLYKSILEKYSNKSVDLYLKATFTDYFFDFLDKYKYKNLYIASGSSEKELREVFKIRKIDQYFIEIYGSPTSKVDIVKSIVKYAKYSVMIGDAKSDMLAAKTNNIDFIFMRQYCTDKNMLQESDVKSIDNLGDLI